MNVYQYTAWASGISAQQYASYTRMFQEHYDAVPSLPNAVHAINPNYKCLVYKNMRAAISSDVSTFRANGWLLHSGSLTGPEVTSTTFGTYFVDIGNPAYQQYLSNWILAQIQTNGFDGVFCDEGFKATISQLWYDPSSTPIWNPRTNSAWTDTQVQDALIALYIVMRNTLGSKLIVPNGLSSGIRWQGSKAGFTRIFSGTNLNGVMGEAWWYNPYGAGAGSWYTEAQWKQSLDSLVELSSGYLNGKLLVAGCLVDLDGNLPIPSGATVDQMETYAYASTLLGIGSNTDVYMFASNQLSRLQSFWQNIFSKSIGTPIGSYFQDANNNYVRNFTGGTVTVNPSTATRGNLAPHTGLIQLSASKKFVFSHWEDGSIDPTRIVNV